MKKILAALAIALTIHATGFAQDGQGMRRTPEDRAQRQVKMMESLKLNEEQQKAVYNFNLRMSEDMQEKNTDREARMAKAKKMQDQRADAYKKILTAEQYSGYEKMQAERRERMMKRMQENNGAEGGND